MVDTQSIILPIQVNINNNSTQQLLSIYHMSGPELGMRGISSHAQNKPAGQMVIQCCRWGKEILGLKSQWETDFEGLKQNRNSLLCLEKRQEHSGVFSPKNWAHSLQGILRSCKTLLAKTKAKKTPAALDHCLKKGLAEGKADFKILHRCGQGFHTQGPLPWWLALPFPKSQQLRV